jgi:hypothetical protein
MYKISTYSLFKFSLLLLFLQSMFAWFLMGKYIAVFISYFPILTAYLFCVYPSGIIREGIFQIKKSTIICVFLLIIIQLYFVRELKVTSLILALSRITVISIVLLLSDQIKIDLFRFFTKSFAIILSASLFVWILFLLQVSLPHTLVKDNLGSYLNYYFFIILLPTSDFLIPRFSSVFPEPGYLGMISAFLLIANRFELKRKEILIISVSIIFSFSLAAFVVLGFALFMFFAFNSRRPLQYVIIVSFVLFLFYYLSSHINAGDNVVYNYIFKRLEYVNGRIAGFNRFSKDLSIYFQKFMNSNDRYFGLGEVAFRKMIWEGGNAGYKVFLLQYGIFGTLVVSLFYISMVLSYNSKMAWILLTACILIFFQAAYPLLECQLFIFITAIATLRSTKNKYFKISKLILYRRKKALDIESLSS